MKKTLSLILIATLSLSLLSGCKTEEPKSTSTPPTADAVTPSKTAENPKTNETAESTEPKEINIARYYDITTLDAHEAKEDGSYDILYLIGEGLVRENGGEILPGVAEKWEISEDGRILTFHLRQTTWNDGSPLTAEDFKYTFLRMLDAEVAHNNLLDGFIFKNGEKYYNGEATEDEFGVTVIDEYTLQIELENPSIETLYTLSKYDYMPIAKSKSDSLGMTYGSGADTILSNGPFVLTSWLHEDKIIMEKSDTYWDKDHIQLTKITGIVGAIDETAIDMLLAGEVDLLETRNFERVEELVADGYKSDSYTANYQFIMLNLNGKTSDTKPFMENINFRKALNYAINREALVNSVYKGATPAERLTSPDERGVSDLFHDEYPYSAYSAGGDPQKAKECLDLALEELGVTIDELPEFTMLCYESQNSLMVLQAVQDMLLSTLGIKTKIDPQPIQQMIAKAMDADWDFWWAASNVGSLDWASANSFAGDYDYTDPTNTNGYVNKEYVDFYKKAITTLDMKERKDLLFEMEQEFLNDPPSIMIGWTQKYVVTIPELNGLVLNPRVDLTYMDLEK